MRACDHSEPGVDSIRAHDHSRLPDISSYVSLHASARHMSLVHITSEESEIVPDVGYNQLGMVEVHVDVTHLPR